MMEGGDELPGILRALSGEDVLSHWSAAVMRVVLQVPHISFVELL